MTQTMDLNKMGLTSMSELEMMEVDGEWNWYGVAAFAAGVAAVVCTGGMALAAGGIAVCCTALAN